MVLVRDPTSGAFAPRYMPNYRIVGIHGPNRITVRDEKGNESVRRASHLKVCDLKQKVTSMVPDQDEYDKFGRSTKLLMHPKDIPSVQFDSGMRNKGEILPNAENSMIEVKVTSGREEYDEIPPKQPLVKVSLDTPADEGKSVDILDLCVESGEFSPKVQNSVEKQLFNFDKQYIADSAAGGVSDGGNGSGWFYSPLNCVSKWSKALKQGVSNSMGLEKLHTVSITAGESEKSGFSFFL